MHTAMQSLKYALAYLATAVSYTRKMFMKLIPGCHRGLLLCLCWFAESAYGNWFQTYKLKKSCLLKKYNIMYNNDIDQLSLFASTPTDLLHSQSKRLCFLSLLIRLSVSQTQGLLTWHLIPCVNTFCFNYHYN